MIIDLILDRSDGIGQYDPQKFYRDCMRYGEIGHEITRALDDGTETDVKKALCKYITDNDYNQDICNFIYSVNWLDEEEFFAVESFLTAYARTKIQTILDNYLMQDKIKTEKLERINRALKYRNRNFLSIEGTVKMILEA